MRPALSGTEGRAVVYQHERAEGLALFEPALLAAGYALTTRFREAQPEDADAGLLIVLGGSTGVNDDPRPDFIARELAVLRQRLREDRPTLGICLGSQLLAAAAGGRVLRGHEGWEIGAPPLRLADTGRRSELLDGADGLPVAQWHRDTFALPAGAELLATTTRYPQIFRVGRSLGLQCHLELDAPALRNWTTRLSSELTDAGLTTAQLEPELDRLVETETLRADLRERVVRWLGAR